MARTISWQQYQQEKQQKSPQQGGISSGMPSGNQSNMPVKPKKDMWSLTKNPIAHAETMAGNFGVGAAKEIMSLPGQFADIGSKIPSLFHVNFPGEKQTTPKPGVLTDIQKG